MLLLLVIAAAVGGALGWAIHGYFGGSRMALAGRVALGVVAGVALEAGLRMLGVQPLGGVGTAVAAGVFAPVIMAVVTALIDQ